MGQLNFQLSKEPFLVFLVIAVNWLFLFYGIDSLSISYEEAYTFFFGDDFVHKIVQNSAKLFGQSDFALRLPFVLFHTASLVLLYKISKVYLKRKGDRVFSVVVFSLLPGVNSSALLVNSSAIVIFFTLLFVYLYLYADKRFSYLLLIAYVLIDNSFSMLYLSLVFYAVYKKDNFLLLLSLGLFAVSMYIFGFDTAGKPKGYFLDTFGVYGAIFSPLVFLYFFYSLYRILIKEEKNILWFISFVSLAISLLLSFRQKILIEDFAPFVVISTPLMVRVFFSSFRVRLPELRHWHRLFFSIIFFTLVLNFLFIYFNKPLYLLIKNPQKHFAYKYHFAKELADKLKSMGISNIYCSDEKMALRLKFYGILSGGSYSLSLYPKGSLYKKVTISYIKIPLETYYVSKINR